MSETRRDNLLSSLVIVTKAMREVPDDSCELHTLESIYNYLSQQLELETYEG